MSWTVLFSKTPLRDERPAGFLTVMKQGEKYSPQYYCLVVSDELYSSLRYDTVKTGEIDPETGEEIIAKVQKKCTYILDIARLPESAETELFYTDDATLVKVVPLG